MNDIEQLTQILNNNHHELNQSQQTMMESVFHHLKIIARKQKFKVSQHSFTTTALVNEAWLKIYQYEYTFRDRNHFYALSAKAMRHILLNQARKVQHESHPESNASDDCVIADKEQAAWLLDLDDALNLLYDYSERLGNVFVYKFFGGLTAEEVAEVLDVTSRTVERDWKKAKLMLASIIES